MEKFSGKNLKKTAGFTLIEILVVIGIIAVLAAIVIVAINPARQFAQARNTQRQSNVDTILNAIGQRMADNKGVFAGTVGTSICPTLPTTSTQITTTTPSATETSANLGCLVPTYISTFPIDPSGIPVSPNTGYFVSVDTIGRITVCAPSSVETALNNPPQICVTR